MPLGGRDYVQAERRRIAFGVLHHPGEAGVREGLFGHFQKSGFRNGPATGEARGGLSERDAGFDLGGCDSEETEAEAGWNRSNRHCSELQ